MEINNDNKNIRQLKKKSFANQVVNSNRDLKPFPGRSHLKGNTESDICLENSQFRYPHKEHQKPVLEHHSLERPIVRRITVDLRPILQQVFDACDADISDTNSESNLTCTPNLSDKGIKKSAGTVEAQSPAQKIIGFSLPSIPNCKSSMGQHRQVQRRASLVSVTNEGSLSCKAEHKSSNSPLVTFPKVVLKQVPQQKKEQKPLTNINTLWVDVEKLQLPISELVKVVKERTDSGQHTIIAQVLCCLREKQDRAMVPDIGVLGRMCQETSHKIPNIAGDAKLTWMKRS